MPCTRMHKGCSLKVRLLVGRINSLRSKHRGVNVTHRWFIMTCLTYPLVRASFDKLKRRSEGIANLDVCGKQREIESLFDRLQRESKLAVFGDKDNRDEVLSEIIATLTEWLNVIWTNVYEHRLQYRRAHACLLFVAESLKHLDEGAGSRCVQRDLSSSTGLTGPLDVGVTSLTSQLISLSRMRMARL